MNANPYLLLCFMAVLSGCARDDDTKLTALEAKLTATQNEMVANIAKVPGQEARLKEIEAKLDALIARINGPLKETLNGMIKAIEHNSENLLKDNELLEQSINVANQGTTIVHDQVVAQQRDIEALQNQVKMLSDQLWEYTSPLSNRNASRALGIPEKRP